MRIGLAAVGFVGALIFPPWVPAICVVLLAVRYRAWEAIILGLLMDLTWQPFSGLGDGYVHMIPVFTLSTIFVVWALEPLRSQLLK